MYPPTFFAFLLTFLAFNTLCGQERERYESPRQDRLAFSLELGAYRFDDFNYDPTVLAGVRVSARLAGGLWGFGEFRLGTPENTDQEKGFLGAATAGLQYHHNYGKRWWPYLEASVSYFEFTGFADIIPDSRLVLGGGAGLQFRFSEVLTGFTEIRYSYFTGGESRQSSQYAAFFGARRTIR